jgi:hypothetical protein
MSRDDEIQIVKVQLFIAGKWQCVYIVLHLNVSGEHYSDSPMRFVNRLVKSTRYTRSLQVAYKVANAMDKRVGGTEYGVSANLLFQSLMIARTVDQGVVAPSYVDQLVAIPVPTMHDDMQSILAMRRTLGVW